MEFKEYLEIFRKHARLFMGVVGICIAGAFAYMSLTQQAYSISMTLDITRQGTQESADYRYDGFYRLQADEKFAETVVEWLKSPRFVTDIYAMAGINPAVFSPRPLSRAFKAEKRSAQVVSINFSANTFSSAKNLSAAVVSVLSKNTENLNENQKDKNWFKIIGHEPVIVENYVSPFDIFLASLVIGVILGFWLVLFVHYFK